MSNFSVDDLLKELDDLPASPKTLASLPSSSLLTRAPHPPPNNRSSLTSLDSPGSRQGLLDLPYSASCSGRSFTAGMRQGSPLTRIRHGGGGSFSGGSRPSMLKVEGSQLSLETSGGSPTGCGSFSGRPRPSMLKIEGSQLSVETSGGSFSGCGSFSGRPRPSMLKIRGSQLSEEISRGSLSSTSDHKVKTGYDDLLNASDDVPSILTAAFSTTPTMNTGSARYASPSHASPSHSPGLSSPRMNAPKCMGLFIGGSHAPQGRNGSAIGEIMCCGNMRCTKCDFKVISFNDKEWSGR
eukprot:gene15611-21716_t